VPVTGKREPIARLHTATPILGSKSNAKIVAFQKNSGFDSYGKEQAFNAPISVSAESAYSTALKYLITSPTNRVLVGDTTIVFWAEQLSAPLKTYSLEHNFTWFLADPPKDDPDCGVRAIKGLYDAIHTGRLSGSEKRFYVLGLSPNAARISIRFWKVGTVSEFADKIKMHFDDFEIVHGPQETEHLCLNKILRATVFEYKMDNVPPNLAGAVIESILNGSPYPITLLQQCIRRIRAERHVNRARAAILKAHINRFNRFHKPLEKEVTVSLDKTNTNPGYLLGRLFAVLEKVQEEAMPGINATIRDRFYGAASSSPVAVFSQLLKLKNHHLAKLENVGRKVNFERLIGEICDGMKSYPAYLALNEQAYFSLGYYHQRQDFFVSKKISNDTEKQ
jgi:CRISPR-associated protein Csd1